MQNVSVSRRYARALLDVAGPQADEILAQLDEFVSFLKSHLELAAALTSPTLTKDQRLLVLEAMLRGSGLHVLLANLLRLLAQRHRVAALPNIARQYRDLVDAKLGRVRGQVVSAQKLQADQLAAIKRSLEAITLKNVLLEAKVDPSLLGGVVTQVGSQTFDGSVRTHLRTLERGLLGATP